MYTAYNFHANYSYDVRLVFESSCVSTQTGDVNIFAMNGLQPHALTSCGNGYPSNSAGQPIGEYVGNTNGAITDVTYTFTANKAYSQLWIYPYGSGSEGPSEYMMVFLGVYACPSCTAQIIYNSGTIPIGTSYSGTIDVGSSAGSGGSGTVTISPEFSTVLTAAQQIEMLPNFTAAVSSGGSFVAEITPCSPTNTVQSYTPTPDSGIFADPPDPENEKTETAVTGQASVITEPSSVKLQIYPTISSGAFTITGGASDLDNANIVVTDESGQPVYRLSNSNATSLRINLERLGNGLYFVHISNESRSSTLKIIVSK